MFAIFHQRAVSGMRQQVRGDSLKQPGPQLIDIRSLGKLIDLDKTNVFICTAKSGVR